MESHEIEAVAQAFYGTMDEARGWDREPERLKARIRSEARAAIATLDEHRGAPVALGEAALDPSAHRLQEGEVKRATGRMHRSVAPPVAKSCLGRPLQVFLGAGPFKSCLAAPSLRYASSSGAIRTFRASESCCRVPGFKSGVGVV